MTRLEARASHYEIREHVRDLTPTRKRLEQGEMVWVLKEW